MAKIIRPGTTSTGSAANAFTIIQPDLGTSPSADSATDTLTLASSNSMLTITGDSTTDTVAFAVVNSTIDHNALSNLTTGDVHTQYAKLTGRATGQTLNGGTAASENLTLTSTAHATKGNIVVAGRLNQGTGNTVGTTNADTFALGTGSNVSGISSGSLGTGNVVAGNYGALAVGNSNTSSGQGCVAIGISNIASGTQAIAMGTKSSATHNGSFTISDGNPDALASGDTTSRVIDSFMSRFKGGWTYLSGTLLGPRFDMYLSTVNTTDATVASVATFVTATDKSYLFEARVTARRTGGVAGAAGDSAVYVIRKMVKNVAGTVTVSVMSTDFFEDQAGWDCIIDNLTTTVRVRVTGAVNNNITWNCTMKVDIV